MIESRLGIDGAICDALESNAYLHKLIDSLRIIKDAKNRVSEMLPSNLLSHEGDPM